MTEINIDQHNLEIQKNLETWNKKPLLRKIYNDFYEEILKFIRRDIEGKVVEIGSGIGNFKSVYPSCIATDIFSNPWINQVESAYKLSFQNNSVSNLILFDVFHHLAFPGSALNEFNRVLAKDGRVIIFEPYISLLGVIIYGIFHHEPVGLFKKIDWFYKKDENPDKQYYAAQGNATRVFKDLKIETCPRRRGLKDWNILEIKKMSALSYVLSGGFSKPSFYSVKVLPFIKKIEKILDFFPFIFATRMLIVLERK